MNPGVVVICGSRQAGTVVWVSAETCCVLTRNGDIWTGPTNQCREPQGQADLDACPIEVPRLEIRPSRSRR